MTVKFPTNVYTGRETENLAGIIYDPTDKKNFYSEDFQNLIAEITAIETYLQSIFKGGELQFDNTGAPDVGWNGKTKIYNSYGMLVFTGNGVAFNNKAGSWSFALNNNNGICVGGGYAMQVNPPADSLVVYNLLGVGTYAPVASAKAEIVSTTKGFLPPRMTTTQRNAITPAEGLEVYDLTLNKKFVYDGTSWQACW